MMRLKIGMMMALFGILLTSCDVSFVNTNSTDNLVSDNTVSADNSTISSYADSISSIPFIGSTGSTNSNSSTPNSSSPISSIPNSSGPISSISNSSSSGSSSSATVNNYYRATSLNMKLADVQKSSEMINLNSVGTQKMLVIPVQFTDYTCAKLSGGCDNIKSQIQTTFFGESEDTGWESVSYYYKSSYGALSLTGTVTDWYQVNMTASAFASQQGYYDPTYYALRNAVSWAKQQLGNNLTEYDQDSDGFIDAVWMVYSLNFNIVNSDVFWAYTFWDYEQTANKSNPIANVYAWASYNFMNEGGYSKPDAHTFIHEMGHVLGLEDYYNYDNYSTYGPVGQLDMMDYNIGDHNSYSKLAMGWTLPYVVTGNAEISLLPFESSGESIIIKNNWSGNAFDEYLIIEFYTPTGLNSLDASQNYTDRPKLFTIPGIKIYHVDSRLGKFNYANGSFQSYTNTIVTNSNTYTGLAHSNTPSYSANSSYSLLHLLESSGNNTFKSGSAATNSTLFTQNSTFGVNAFSTFKFNSGTTVGYSMKVTNVSATSATITFTVK